MVHGWGCLNVFSGLTIYITKHMLTWLSQNLGGSLDRFGLG